MKDTCQVMPGFIFDGVLNIGIMNVLLCLSNAYLSMLLGKTMMNTTRPSPSLKPTGFQLSKQNFTFAIVINRFEGLGNIKLIDCFKLIQF